MFSRLVYESWGAALLRRLWVFCLGLLLAPLLAAAPLDPQAANLKVMVREFTLTGLDHPSRGLSLAGVLQQAWQEQGKFGAELTVEELNQLADALTLYVRSFGFPFHTVYLPPQRVEAGRVELRLQEGVLGAVHVINKTRLQEKRFARPFAPQVGQLLYGPAVEERVQALKNQAGFKVFAFYSRGVKPGEAVLNLRVDEAAQQVYGLRVDNYGSAASGKQRAIAQYSRFELTGRHDRLDVGLLQTLGSVSNRYGSLAYQLPSPELDYLWDLSLTNNQFELGDRYAALGLEGDVKTLGSGISWIQRQQPAERTTWRAGLYDKRNRLDAGVTSLAREVSQALTLEWSRTWASDKGAVANLQVEYSYGRGQVERLPDASFNKIDLNSLYSQGFGSGQWRQLVQLTGRAQASDVSLPSIEAMALSGAYGVRGFEAGLFNAEQAALASIEWRLPNLLTGANWRLEPYLMAEAGMGRDLTYKGRSRSAHLADVGLGISASWGRHARLNLLAVSGLKGSVDGMNLKHEQQVLCELRWQ
jgi:hemolysin activation/secretion protein